MWNLLKINIDLEKIMNTQKTPQKLRTDMNSDALYESAV
jgi:hypothetical protein